MKGIQVKITRLSYLESVVLLLFLIAFTGCKSSSRKINSDQENNPFEVRDLTEEGIFTSGIEGPAVDCTGNLYAVNFDSQGTIGIIEEGNKPKLFVELPEGSIGNGIRFDRKGDMLIADYTGHNILKVFKDTRDIIVFAHHPGMNQPNDIAVTADDFIYASDPNWADSTGNLWRISYDGTITLLEDSMGTTNGIEVNFDEKKLYVNESIQRRIWVYNLTDQGDISNKKLFMSFTDFGLDGMRCDKSGNLYVTRYGKGTVLMISPEGEELAEIKLKGNNPTNISFGGFDGRTCYITVADRGCIETFQAPYPGRSFVMCQERDRKQLK
jgi:sugar lactone lactonase YvrE